MSLLASSSAFAEPQGKRGERRGMNPPSVDVGLNNSRFATGNSQGEARNNSEFVGVMYRGARPSTAVPPQQGRQQPNANVVNMP
ncbi:MAG: hypothetical protein K2Q01_03625 [Rickettsiales bacterium]|nr:hypothetical protein [Rickettsiales bacterium]